MKRDVPPVAPFPSRLCAVLTRLRAQVSSDWTIDEHQSGPRSCSSPVARPSVSDRAPKKGGTGRAKRLTKKAAEDAAARGKTRPAPFDGSASVAGPPGNRRTVEGARPCV